MTTDTTPDQPTSTDSAEVPTTTGVVARLQTALSRLAAVVALYAAVPTEQLDALTTGERTTFDLAASSTSTRHSNTVTRLETVNGADDAEAFDHYAAYSEDDATRAEGDALRMGEMIVEAVARGRATMPIGNMAEADVNRGRRFVDMIGHGHNVCDARLTVTGVTVSDLTAYGVAMQTACDDEARAISRTLRAADRTHGYGLFAPVMSELVDDGSLLSPVWRVDAASIDSLPMEGPSTALCARLRVADSPREHGPRATVASLVSTILSARRAHIAEVNAIAVRLLAEAEASTWCGEYETTVDRLNGSLTVTPDQPFQHREREVDYSATGVAWVDVTIRVPVTVSAIVTASSDDDATQLAYDALNDVSADTDTYTIAEALGVDVSTLRSWSWEATDTGDSVDDVDVERVY